MKGRKQAGRCPRASASVEGDLRLVSETVRRENLKQTMSSKGKRQQKARVEGYLKGRSDKLNMTELRKVRFKVKSIFELRKAPLGRDERSSRANMED
jgi:hypothetical protein